MLRELDRRIATYHEAGHAAVGHLMGFHVDGVYIGEEIPHRWKKRFELIGLTVFSSGKNGWCGALDYFDGDVLKHEKQAKIYAAGRIAEQLFFPDDWNRSCSLLDWKGIKMELAYRGTAKMSNIIISTRKLLSRKENKRLVRRVAWVLYHRGYIDRFGMPIILGSKKRRWRIKRKLKQIFSKIKKRVESLVKK